MRGHHEGGALRQVGRGVVGRGVVGDGGRAAARVRAVGAGAAGGVVAAGGVAAAGAGAAAAAAAAAAARGRGRDCRPGVDVPPVGCEVEVLRVVGEVVLLEEPLELLPGRELDPARAVDVYVPPALLLAVLPLLQLAHPAGGQRLVGELEHLGQVRRATADLDVAVAVPVPVPVAVAVLMLLLLLLLLVVVVLVVLVVLVSHGSHRGGGESRGGAAALVTVRVAALIASCGEEMQQCW